MKVWMRAASGLWLALCALSGHAADGKVPLTPEQARREAIQTFRLARDNVRGIEGGLLVDLKKEEVEAVCDLARQKDQELAGHDTSNLVGLRQKAREASVAQNRCEDARRSKERLDKVNRDLLDTARSMLRHLAFDIDQCQDDASTACAAERLKAVVGRLSGLLKQGQSVAALEAAHADLVKSAADAQQRVDKVKKEMADAYVLGDTAVSTALANEASKAPGEQGKELRVAAEQGRRSAVDTRDAVTRAQRASNELVRNAIELLSCKSGEAPCLSPDQARTQAEASAADTLLAANLALAGTSYLRTKEANWAAAAGEHAALADRQRSVAFARLLDTYPDARSLVGESSAGQINTSGDGTDATIKISLAKVGLGSARQQAIILKAPLGEPDRVKTPVALGYSSYWMRALDPRKDEREYDLLWVTGFSPKVDFATRSYRDPAHIEKSIGMRAREWTLAGYVGWYWLRNRSPDLHLLTVEVKRAYDAKAKQIRCPAPVLDTVPTCFDDVYEKPEKHYERQFKYQWRTQLPTALGSFALSPAFSYDQRSKEKRLELPLYLWRPEGKDQPFNAGIKLDIGSKSADRVGLFVGTTFDLYGLPDR